MLDISDLRFLVALSEAASLASAARQLNVTPPAVSQRLAQIEARLHLRLIERGRGPLRLTEEGAFLVTRAQAILGEVTALAEDISTRAGRVEGPLQVIAPFGYGRLHVAPVLSRFAARHPGLRPMLTLSEDPIAAMREGPWDVLVHVGQLPDLRITQRRLAANRRFLVAAPEYLAQHGSPAAPSDMAGHRIAVLRENRADATLWPLTSAEGVRVNLRIDPVYSCNDGEVLRRWALEGFGIVERSEWSVAADLESGRLVRVLPGWSLPDADIVALLNPRGVRARRVDLFVAALLAGIG